MFGRLFGSSASCPRDSPIRSAPFANWRSSRGAGASRRARMRAIVAATAGVLRGSGRRSAAVRVSSTPCSAGQRLVNSVVRLGEHIAVLQKALSKVIPVRASSASPGISDCSQPLSSGQ